MTAFPRADARELMDDPIDSLAELEENLRDIERANRFLGGIEPVAREVARCGARTMLDVGCGSGDVAFSVAMRLRRRGKRISITCLDRSEQMLEIARARTEGVGLTYVRGDAMALPFPDGTFDVTVCSLALHHFSPGDAVVVLRELRRVAKRAAIVCDLRRSRRAHAAAWLLAHAASRNRLTRHDAPLSVRRAYTPAEALELARAAGWNAPQVREEPWFRMTLLDETNAEAPR